MPNKVYIYGFGPIALCLVVTFDWLTTSKPGRVIMTLLLMSCFLAIAYGLVELMGLDSWQVDSFTMQMVKGE